MKEYGVSPAEIGGGWKVREHVEGEVELPEAGARPHGKGDSLELVVGGVKDGEDGQTEERGWQAVQPVVLHLHLLQPGTGVGRLGRKDLMSPKMARRPQSWNKN